MTRPTEIPGWRWLKGCSAVLVTHGRSSTGYTYQRVVYESDMGPVVVFGSELLPLLAGSQPDLSDASTVGCILHLLGDEAWRVAPSLRLGSSLGDACVAVAESLGRWPGGAP